MAKKEGGDLMSCYTVYSVLLAVKMITLVAMSYSMKAPERVQRASLQDLKFLTPFWIIAAVYVNLNPNINMAMNLIRAFAICRLIIAAGYICDLPGKLTNCAGCVSIAITAYMGACVLVAYQNSL